MRGTFDRWQDRAAHPNGASLLIPSPRQETDLIQVEVLAVMGRALFRPQSSDNFDGLDKFAQAVFALDAHGLKLFRSISESYRQNVAAIGRPIQDRR